MEAGGGLIQDVEQAPSRPACGQPHELAGDLEPLGFAARECRRRLAQAQVAKPTEASRRSLTLIEVVLAKTLCASATVMLRTSLMDLSRCRTARIFGWKRRPSQTSHVA